MKLTDKQKRVLDYLDRCDHSTDNIMRKVFEAVPGPTLEALRRRGFVTVEFSHFVTVEFSHSILSTNRRWTITDAGRKAIQ